MAEDLSKLSDEELNRRVAQKMAKKDYSKMTDEELDAAVAEKMALQQQRLASPSELVGGSLLNAYQQIEPYVKPAYPYIAPVAKGIGAVGEFMGDVISYVDAPMKQAAMAPARLAQGEVSQAITKPFSQIISAPSQAPSWKQVAEAYGVPEQQSMAPIELAQPLYFPTSFEKGQISPEQAKGVISTPEKQKQYEQLIQSEMPTTTYPSEVFETAAEAALGGKGLGMTISGLKKVGSGAASALGSIADVISGSKVPSEAIRQTKEGLKTTGEVAKRVVDEFLDPTKQNTLTGLGEQDVLEKTLGLKTGQQSGSVAKQIFGDEIPDALKYTEDSEILRIRRALADKAGGGALVKEHNDAIEKITKFIKKKPIQIADKSSIGVPLDKASAGQFIVDTLNAKKNDIFANISMTRRELAKQFRDPKGKYAPISAEPSRLVVKKVKEMREDMKGLKLGKDNPLAKQIDEMNLILDDLENLYELHTVKVKDVGNKKIPIATVNDLVNNLDSLGKLAFDVRYSEVLDKTKLKELYHLLNDSFFLDVERKIGPLMTAEMRETNKKIHDFLQNMEPITNALKKQPSPENVFKRLTENANFDELTSLKNLLDDKELNVLKSSWLQGKLSEKVDTFSDVDNFRWGQLSESIRPGKNKFFDYFFKEEGPEITVAARLGKQMGNPYASRSGTGLSVGFQEQMPRLVGHALLKRQKSVMEGTTKGLTKQQAGAITGPAALVPLALQKQNIIGPSKMQEAQMMVFDSLMKGVPTFQIDPQISQSKDLTPTEKALLRKKLTETTF